MGHFTFFSFIPIILRGQLPKEGQADGFCLSHLKCPVLESCSLNLPQMTQDGKWMFSCLLGTKESILSSQWPFPLWVNPENKVDGGVLSEGVSCSGLGCSYRDKDHCWLCRCSGISSPPGSIWILQRALVSCMSWLLMFRMQSSAWIPSNFFNT